MQNINSDLIRGNIDTIILKTMENGDMYGLDIIREVENKSNGTYELKQPTLYSCLKRLENKEFISSYWLDSEIGGKRHYYKLTDKGREVIQSKQDEWSKSKLLIDNLLGDFNYDEYRLVKKDDYEKIINGKPVIQYIEVEKPVSDDSVITSTPNSSTTPSVEQSNDNQTSLSSSYEDVNDSFASDTSLEDEFSKMENDILNSVNNQTSISTTSNTSINEEAISQSQNTKANYFDNELICFKPKEETTSVSSITQITTSIQSDSSEQTTPVQTINQTTNQINGLVKTVQPAQNFGLEFNQTTTNESSSTVVTNIAESNQEQPKAIIEEKVIQQDLFSSLLSPYQIEVDNTISKFSNNISLLNKINSSDEDISTIIDRVNEEKNQKEQEEQKNQSISDSNSNSSQSESPTPTMEDKATEEPKNFHTEYKKDNLLSELNELKVTGYTNYNISFENDDGYDSKSAENVNNSQKNQQLYNKQQNQNNYSNNQNTSLNNNQANLSSSNSYSVSSRYNSSNAYNDSNNNTSSDSNFNTNSDNSYNSNYNSYSNNQASYPTEKIVDKKYDQLFSARDPIDEIIYKNVNDYTSENSKELIEKALSYYKTDNDDGYKQRINNLTEYAKDSFQDNEDVQYSKDIQSLKEEYKTKGIVIKEFNKENSFKLKKDYLVINKLNLIKSFILLFGYIFILSAVYIILNNTNMKDMHGFSFKYFLYGFIPFIIYMIYYLVLYLLNPYKKVPTKHSVKVMIFVSIIITIQLILITYCLNLQFGFYSFTQEGYNHLLWIIPTIVSFAPIISTLIHCGLLHSKNFNI